MADANLGAGELLKELSISVTLFSVSHVVLFTLTRTKMLKLLVGTTLAGASAFAMGGSARVVSSRASVQMASFHDFKATALGGEEVDMASFKGKPILVLNVASL